jgi:hypothetical protein
MRSRRPRTDGRATPARGLTAKTSRAAVLSGCYRRALELAERAFREIPTDSLICETEGGGLKAHPALALWLRLERAAAEFGMCLGVEVDRSKRPMGRPTGAASAPDPKSPPRITRIK